MLTDYFEIAIIELPKAVKAYEKTPNDELLQWMMFLQNPEEKEVTRIMEENEDIKEAKEELERISQDDILRRKALSRIIDTADRLQFEDDLKEAKEEARKKAEKALVEGKTEGKKEKTREVIQNLKNMNLTKQQIAQAVGLDEKQIEEILKEKK